MSDSTVVDAFVGAVNFCTGSQTDYSTCIANNMRFTPFRDDTYEASAYAGMGNKKQDLPLLYGDVYVDLIPIAIANIFTRVKMTNSYGGVSFRCPDVFSRPRLPLPRLQDLGIESQEIINIIGPDPEDPPEDDPLEFEGIPISADDSVIGWLFNVINLLIGYTTSVSNTMTIGKEIKGVILGMLNYYKLPEKSDDMKDEADKSLRIYNEAIRYANKILNDSSSSAYLINTINEVVYYINRAESYMITIRSETVSDIVNPLSVITPETDFTVFNFTITDGVADTVKDQENTKYPFIFSYSMQSKNSSSVYGIPPQYPKDNWTVAKKVVDIDGTMVRNTVADSLTLIADLYQVSNVDIKLDQIKANKTFYLNLKSRRVYYTTTASGYIATEPIPDPDDDGVAERNAKYQTIIDKTNSVLDTFTYATVIADVEAAYDPDNHETVEDVKKILDDYFEDYGNAANIELYALADAQQDLYSKTSKITEIFLGGDYKDAGKFYYADLAYAVGYAKLSEIKSIQINDEYYKIDEGGEISESGCVKYTFSRHVLPTYVVDVNMYIYPGTPDQPYCPTINKYHNFLTSKYSGMFTKQDGEDMGLFVFKGYRPMLQTVEEVIKLGAIDLNSINLNDPSLDDKAYETMLMKEIKNLTNASSINDEPISTADFKYYMSSTLVDETVAANYPGMAIIEFKNFPIGSSMSFPKIKVNVVSEDLL